MSKEKLSGTVAKTGEADFEKLSRELQSDTQKITVGFNEKLQELDVVEAEKENSKVRYRRSLDEGDEENMALCLKGIREKNEQAERLRDELETFPGKVKEIYQRQTKIFALARAGQSKAEGDLRAAEAALKLTGGKVRRCYSLQGLINSLNTDIQDLVRTHKKEKAVFEDELKTPRSTKEGFWVEKDDPFAQGTLEHYQELKDDDGLSLPLMLNFKDKETAPIDDSMLKTSFEKSEALQAEFGSIESFLKFKGLIIVQVLERYILRANGGGDRRRGMAGEVALSKCK